jgi:hypothetical protein
MLLHPSLQVHITTLDNPCTKAPMLNPHMPIASFKGHYISVASVLVAIYKCRLKKKKKKGHITCFISHASTLKKFTFSQRQTAVYVTGKVHEKCQEPRG